MNETQQDRGLRGWWRQRRMQGNRARQDQEAAWTLYRHAVARARDPELYTRCEVPDTPDGRFEMVALHTALVLRRLAETGPAGQEMSLLLVESLVTDMDRSVRELGVGDLSVGKYVTGLAGSLMARLDTLRRALAEDDRGAIATMLLRNAFPSGAPPSPVALDRLIDRLEGFASALEAVPAERLLRGDAGVATLEPGSPGSGGPPL
jgi:cytochrome b pre-mRNA-processing protein 3